MSVVMPVYNGSAHMAEAIESVFAQTYESWELLIVDDASTDDSLAIARGYERLDRRVRVFSSGTNAGSGLARNRAIEVASGRYLAVMDADDISMPDRFEAQVAALDDDDALVVVAMQLEEFGDWGGPVRSSWPTETDGILRRTNAGKMPLPHPSSMFVTEEVRACGGYDVYCRRAQDYALFLRLERRHSPESAFACLPAVGVRYRTERPVSFGYVLKNERYSELARRRNGAESFGDANSAGRPIDPPNVTPRLVSRAGLNWMKRAVRERFFGHADGALRSDTDCWPTWRTLPHFLRVEGKANLREPKSFAIVVLLRLCQCLINDRESPRLLGNVATLGYRGLTEVVFGTELRPKTRVGLGLVIFHGFGLVVNDQAVLGKGVVLRNGVTIGNASSNGGAPVLGDNVEVGANAVIIGGISVGSNARVGAGSVVVKDVPPGATVVGNPARAI